MKRKTKWRVISGGLVATVCAVPAAFVGYILGYHSSLPIFGGGPIAVILPGSIVWVTIFAVGVLRARALSAWEPSDE